jgi:hypothetical protein
MVTTQDKGVEGASSSETPAQKPASSLWWLTVLAGLPGAIVANVFMRKQDRKFANQLLIVGAAMSIFGLVAILMTSSANNAALNQLTAPTPTVVTQAPTTTPTTPTTSGPSLVLPTESENDAPTTVVGYMDGPNGIFASMCRTGNTAYLPYYYYSSDEYQPLEGQLQGGARLQKATITNVTIDSSSFGSITAEFDAQADNQPVIHHVTTYQWNSDTNLWGVTSVQATPVG